MGTELWSTMERMDVKVCSIFIFMSSEVSNFRGLLGFDMENLVNKIDARFSIKIDFFNSLN